MRPITTAAHRQIFSTVRTSDGVTTRDVTPTHSPIVSVETALHVPAGFWTEWAVHTNTVSYVSLRPPPWLLPAPANSTTDLDTARGNMSRDRAEQERRLRDSTKNIIDRAGPFLDELGTLDVAGHVWWWDHDHPEEHQPFIDGEHLAALLRAAFATADPRHHLIDGLRDEHGYAIW